VRSKDWGEGSGPVHSIPYFLPCFLKLLFRIGERQKHCRLSTQLEGQCSNDVLSIGLTRTALLQSGGGICSIHSCLFSVLSACFLFFLLV
jgi:hypothetical protein